MPLKRPDTEHVHVFLVSPGDNLPPMTPIVLYVTSSNGTSVADKVISVNSDLCTVPP